MHLVWGLKPMQAPQPGWVSTGLLLQHWKKGRYFCFLWSLFYDLSALLQHPGKSLRCCNK